MNMDLPGFPDPHLPVAPPGEGRVLRVKLGYNPNSSSVGSAIPTFLVLAAASGALTVVLLNALDAVGSMIRRRRSAMEVEQEEEETK